MPPKRKSAIVEESGVTDTKDQEKDQEIARPAKKARVKKATDASSSETTAAKAESSKTAEKNAAPAQTWQEIKLDGEDGDNGVPVYDDCNEVRRKIRLLQKEPNFKVTHWLKDIGNVNSNSFQRFMKAKGPTGGAGNGTYYAAYVYFEKRRILDGKKKTPTRTRNEHDHPSGFPLAEQRYTWYYMPK